MAARLELRSLAKAYRGVPAVRGLDHTFAEGEITTIVGPSGSGKSTALWMIAGLIAPDAGSVHVDGVDVTRLPAERRDIGMVFQSYALFPHLTVAENVEFGLRVRRVPKPERQARALEVLELVRMARLAKRRVDGLSGGEQQRVALARALAFRPRVLLMDEPLSALDARLREDLRHELFRILKELAITTVYVTHDQTEAMGLGSELLVMMDGAVEQRGRPVDVYLRPASPRVGEFLGAANVFAGVCASEAGVRTLRLPFARLPAPDGAPDGPCWVMIRPEDLEVAVNGKAQFSAVPESTFFLGNLVRVTLDAGGQRLVLDAPNHVSIHAGRPLGIGVRDGRVFAWPRDENHGNGARP